MEGANAIFLIRCMDRKGLVAGITNFFYEKGLNIVNCQQYTDVMSGQYFMRLKLDLSDLSCSRSELEKSLTCFGEPMALEWSVCYSDYVPRMAVLVSKASHCLYDLLVKQREGTLRCEIPLIVSNHPDLEYVAQQFRIPYFCVPVRRENKAETEPKIIELLKAHHIDLVVLARYMQVVSPEFISLYSNRMINIHHAFLPAFQGANPYLRAFQRGVKMIGATAHYVTEDLDEGPIIEQDVVRVTHEYGPEDLSRIGRDVEMMVLSRAVKAHLESRIIVHENRTVVFSGGAGA